MQTFPNHKVFISYAHEDAEKARLLYSNLKEWNLDPWLDEESLLPGMRWEQKIKEAIKNSRYFIPLLSKHSTKEGRYVQKELEDAIKILNEYSESEIYLIPIRLDDCQIPESTIKEIHIVDLFPDWNQGLKKVLRAMGIEEKPPKLDKVYWENLVRDINNKKCIPIIGDEALEIYNVLDDKSFFTSKEIAAKLAKEYEYPLDEIQLPKVAQYLAIRENNDVFPKQIISNILKSNPEPDFADKHRNSLHAVLAKLDLSIYITTTYDLFMEKALESNRKNPHSECCRWNDRLKALTKMGSFPSVFSKGARYKGPTENDPLVYHLHGNIEYPNSMVLTERDYFEFIINMNKIEEEQGMLPPLLRREIPQCTLLCLGYRLDDIDFLSIFQGALSFSSTTRGMKNNFLIIQLPSIDDYGKRDKVIKYLQQKSKHMFDLIVYWGTINEFIEEFQKNLKEFQNTV